MLQHVLREVHVVFKVGEGDLGLDHPELGCVALRVGVLRAKRRPEGVHVTEGHGEVLGIELAGHSKTCRLAEEVAAPVNLPRVKFPARFGSSFLAHARHVFHIERGHAEHLACPLAVGRRDDRGVHVDEPAILKEAVDRRSRDAADAENGAEEIRARAEMLLGAKELDRGALFLKRVIRGAGTLDGDGLRGELEGLLRLGRELDGARADEGRVAGTTRDLVIVGEGFAVHDDLEVLEAAAVVERDEAEVLHVADGLGPAGDGDGLAVKLLHVAIELDNLGAIHVLSLIELARASAIPREDDSRVRQLFGGARAGTGRRTGRPQRFGRGGPPAATDGA